MPTYAYPTRTKTLDTATVATLEDALRERDIPQAYTNALFCQLFLGSAKEPGLDIQGQNLKLPGIKRPMRRTMGGARAEVFVNFEVGVTAQAFTGATVLNTSMAEGPTVSFSDWAFYTAYVAITTTDKIKNTGSMKRLDRLLSRQNQEIRQLTRVMEADICGTNTDTTEGTQDAFAGMQHKILNDPTTSTVVQGLNQSTFTPWRNAVDASVGSFASGGLDAMRSMWFSVSGQNGMEPPHLLTTTSTVAGYAVKALEGIHRIVGSLNGADLSASRLPTFMGVPIVHTDDQQSGTIYYWNFDYLENLVHEGADWVDQIPGRPNDQAIEDQKRWIFAAAPMMLLRREKFGKLAGITA